MTAHQRLSERKVAPSACPATAARSWRRGAQFAAVAIGGALTVMACGLAGPEQTGRPDGLSALPSTVAPTATGTAAQPPSGPPPSSGPSAAIVTPTTERLDVTCEGGEAFVAVPRVVAQADGVHVQIRNPFHSVLDVVLERPTGEGVMDAQVEDAEAELVAAAEPGPYAIGCGTARASFEVIDPLGRYISAELSCADSSGTAGAMDYVPGATGPRGDVVAVARSELRGLQPDDRIERAGYGAGTGPAAVRITRADAVIAVLGYSPDGHGGWLLTSTRACAGSGVSAQPPG